MINDAPIAAPQATLSVCVTCRMRCATSPGYREPGRDLVAALQQRLAGSPVAVRAVQCFAVCNRPCTIALQAAGKWSLLTGDLTLERDIDAIVAVALIYAGTGDGIVPWAQTPMAFRRGGIARLPPAPSV